jgi:hypothetical protein
MMINWWAVLVAGISAFVLGGIWYSPKLFGTAWMEDNKLTMEEIRKGNFAKIYGWAFILSLIAAVNLGMFLSDTPDECTGVCAANYDMGSGAMYGALAGLWVFCFVAIHGLFEHKPGRLIFINGGYALAALALMGAILGLWR